MIFFDQMGSLVELLKTPQRIVSLVPSQTELLFDLGLAENIVGITKFCVHPKEKIKGKTVVGGTKNFNFALIRQLNPDLIIGNKEENYAEGIRELQLRYPVWMSDIADLAAACQMIEQIGRLTNTTKAAINIVRAIKSGFASLPAYPATPVAYLIWENPLMSVGQDTFIHQMLQAVGFTNVFSYLNRYPVITPDLLQETNPQLVLLSSEPYPFKEKHLQEFRKLCPQAIVKLVDGEFFSWYGSRLQQAPAYFKKLRQEVEAAPSTIPRLFRA